MGYVKTIIEEMGQVIKKVDEAVLVSVAQRLAFGERLFIVGEGRSGLMGKAFAMRLMHLGATVFVVGETITPAVAGSDLVVAISGSGKTKAVVDVATKVQNLGGEVISLTTNLDSELAKHSSLVLHIPAATKFRKAGEAATIQPLGSLFDQSVHIVCDSICLYYAKFKDENNESALLRHSNME